MADGHERPVAFGTEPDRLVRAGLVAMRGEGLGPRQRQLHRTPDFARRDRGEDLVRPDIALAAEAATDERVAHAHGFRRDGERRGERHAHTPYPLRRIVESQPSIAPVGDRSRRFHRVVVAVGGAIDVLDAHCCARESLVDVADARVRLRVGREGNALIERLAKVDGRGLLLVAHAHEPGGIHRLLEGFGDDQRDRLSLVLDAIALQRQWRLHR